MKSLFAFSLLISGFAYIYSNSKFFYYNCYYEKNRINSYPLTPKEASHLKSVVKKKLSVELVCKDEMLLGLHEFYELRD